MFDPKLWPISIFPLPRVSATAVVSPNKAFWLLKAPWLKNVDAPPLAPVMVTEVSGLFSNADNPTMITDAGIVIDVSPRFLNPP